MTTIVRTTAAALAITAAVACGTASVACGTASAQTAAPTAAPDAGSSAAFNSVMCALLGISSEHNIFCTGLIIG
ncbi:hypothetical protein [Nocardia sp. NPDC058114]|uniref:hypothetical protein n=1 Tax=Nocardia sp. NPDC058114 TaxID=3346346 RepID=UPI0036DC50D1